MVLKYWITLAFEIIVIDLILLITLAYYVQGLCGQNIFFASSLAEILFNVTGNAPM